jgi:hypothetical protein
MACVGRRFSKAAAFTVAISGIMPTSVHRLRVYKRSFTGEHRNGMRGNPQFATTST